MNTKHTKLLLPLAALALVSVACDPFPAKPGGDPAVVRVITYGGALGDSNTVETVTGGNTVSTDFAQPDDLIRIQFNKPMDGSSIQAYTNYNAPAGVDPCTPAAGLNVSSLGVGTLACYDPSSATDGGQMVITPGAPLLYGTTYTVTGTVRDYQGKALTLNVTITVDKRPLPFAVDGYTTGVDWFDSGTATSYEVLRAPDVAGAPGTFASLMVVDPAVDCDGVLCEVLDTEKAPDTSYWYQVKETSGAVTTRPAALGPATTLGALTPTLGVASTPIPPLQTLTGIIRIAWGAIQGSDGYDVETSPDGLVWTLFTHHTTSPRTVYYGTPAPGTAVPAVNGTLTSGATYYVRVTPTFADLFAAAKGNVASKVAP